MNFKLFLLITTLASTRCSLSQHSPKNLTGEDRIIDGQPTYNQNWPFIAVVALGPIAECGGSLISRSWVVTAGHCLASELHADVDIDKLLGIGLGVDKLKTSDINTLFPGSKTQNMVVSTIDHVFPIELFIIHPEFKTEMTATYQILINDIALIKLQHAVGLSGHIQLIKMETDDVAPGTVCSAAGWGVKKPFTGKEVIDQNFYHEVNQLYEAFLEIMGTDDCIQVLYNVMGNVEHLSAEELGSRIHKVKKDKLCAISATEGDSVAKGDSGGPIVCDGRLHGVISEVIAGTVDGVQRHYSIFTSIAEHIDWIKEEMGKHGESEPPRGVMVATKEETKKPFNVGVLQPHDQVPGAIRTYFSRSRSTRRFLVSWFLYGVMHSFLKLI